VHSGPSNGSRILELQVAISFSIAYEDNFHTTYSKFHEVIPPLYIAAARRCFTNPCAADHCICYAFDICSASTESYPTSHSLSSHISQYACPLSQFMSFMHGHVTKPMAAGAEVQPCYPFPALRGNISHAPWSDAMGKAQSSKVEMRC
jgi:hypothetical protein